MGRTLEARLATGKKNPHRKMGVLFLRGRLTSWPAPP